MSRDVSKNVFSKRSVHNAARNVISCQFKDILLSYQAYGGSLPESLQSLHSEFENTYRSYENAMRDRETDHKSIMGCYDAFHDLYWRTLEDMIPFIMSVSSPESLVITDELKLFMNFAFMDGRLSPHYLELSQSLEIETAPGLGLYTVHEWLEMRYTRVMKRDRRERLLSKREELTTALETLPRKIEDIKMKRRELLEKLLPAQDVEPFIEKLDRFVIEHYRFAKEIVGQPALERRKQQAEFSRRQAQLDEEFRALIATVPKRDVRISLEKLNHTVASMMVAGCQIEDDHEAICEDIRADSEERKTISVQQRVEQMQKEIKKVKRFSQGCAIQGHAPSYAVLAEASALLCKSALEDIMNNVDEYDPFLFQNRHAHKEGRPCILLVPGGGQAVYIPGENMICVPVVPSGESFVCLAPALIAYRFLHDDEHQLAFSLKSDIREYKMILQGTAQQQAFMRDYIAWMTQDVHGHMVLTDEKRKWFYAHIAPKINDWKIPVAFRREMDAVHDTRHLLHSYEASLPDEKDSERHAFRFGLLKGLSEEYSEAVQWFKMVLDKNPHHWNSLYNLAFAYERMHDKKAALEKWESYHRTAPRSLWTTYAKYHYNELRQK